MQDFGAHLLSYFTFLEGSASYGVSGGEEALNKDTREN